MSTSQKQAARKFVEYWAFQRGSGKGEDQQFWNSFLRDVLGITEVEQHIKYQVPVQLKNTTKFLDAWIPETRVLIEHKSRGVNLDAMQAGHGGLTPYEQAVEYDNARPFDEKARWIVTCNFDEFRIYDRAKPLAPPLTLKLGILPKEAYRLAFLVNPKEKAVDRELEISVQAGGADAINCVPPGTPLGGSQLAATETAADAQERFPPRAAETAAPHKIAQAAQAILDARARYPESSLAAYGLASDTPESGMVAHLFKLYSNLIGE